MIKPKGLKEFTEELKAEAKIIDSFYCYPSTEERENMIIEFNKKILSLGYSQGQTRLSIDKWNNSHPNFCK